MDILDAANKYVSSCGGFIPYGAPTDPYCSHNSPLPRPQEDCVSLLNAILFSCGISLTREQQQLLLIDFKELQTPETYQQAVLSDDPRTYGIAGALVTTGWANYVAWETLLANPEQAPGTVVQYHYDNGRKGHAGIIKSIRPPTSLYIFGSHRSLSPAGTGTIAVEYNSFTKCYFAKLKHTELVKSLSGIEAI